MDRIHDLTYEISRLDSDIADLQYQLSRQSTPLPGQILTRHTRGVSLDRRTNTRTPIPRDRLVSFVDRFVNPDRSNDRSGASSAVQQGTGGQGSTSAIPLGRPRQSSSRNSSDVSTGNVSNRKNVKPATYDGKSSWLDFKSHFEICAQLNEWDIHEKGMYLAVALRGGAQAVLGNLPVESHRNYDALCKALEDRYAPSNQMDLYRAQLKDRQQKASESVPELGQDIRRLTNLAYAQAPSDVKETLAMEFFIDALHSSEMRLRIKQSRPKNLNEAVCLAVELDAFNNAEKRRQEVGGVVRTADIQPTKQAEMSPVLKMVEETNKALAEMRKEIKKLRDSQRQTTTERKTRDTSGPERTKLECYFCGKEGHIKRKCRLFLQSKQKEKEEKEHQTSVKDVRKISIGSLGSANMTSHSGMFVDAEVNGMKAKLLIDTGATISVVGPRFTSGRKIDPLEGDIYIADGSPLLVKGVTNVPLVIDDMSMNQNVVVADIGIDGILGLDFMKSHACSIDLVNCTIVLDGREVQMCMTGKIGCYRVFLDEAVVLLPRSEILTLCPVQTQSGKLVSDLGVGIVEPIESFTKSDRALTARTLTDNATKVPVRLMNLHNDSQNLQKGTVVAQYVPVTTVLDETTNSSDLGDGVIPDHLRKLYERTEQALDEGQSAALKAFLLRYQGLFAKDDFDLGRAESVKHRITTRSSAPIKQAPRRLPEHMHAEVNKHLDTMLERNVIQPSNSPWSSPIVLARKKDGTTRFCIDYRKLNDVTIKDAYPLPLIQESLDHLSGAKWFSTLDLCSGYWQVDVEPSDRPKTAFATRRGLYEFSVMPFGLCNAPATFQRLMESVLRGLQFETCLVYLDDIIVVGKTFEEMIKNLSQVFNRLAEAGLKLKAKKCNLFASEVEYLGHVITEAGVATSKDKTQAIENWPVPRNVTEVRSFLGLCSYYRRFVPSFASMADPLHKLTKKGNSFKWTEDCQRSFDSLRHALTSPPILANPDFSKPFILDCDASDQSIGAVLSQKVDGIERVCAYASRTLSKSERKYCVTRKELLAVVHFVKHFRHYLYGRQFLVRTDHSSLRWLMQFKNPQNQLARWLEILSEFDFQIQHRPGRQHSNADALSRIPCRQCGFHTDWEKETCSVNRVTSVSADTMSLQSLQSDDKDLQRLRSWLECKARPDSEEVQGESYYLKSLYSQFNRMCLIDDILYRRWDNFDTNTVTY